MKLFVKNYNNILDKTIVELKKRLWYTDNISQADGLLLWQDVRGDCARIAKIFREIGKPVFVVQHGRGATRDYDKPNSFPFLADRLFVWGPAEKRRMDNLGYADRVVVTGSPLFQYLKPRTKRPYQRVLFAPIILEKEEPENLLVYAKLKEWESRTLYKRIKDDYRLLKKGWAEQQIVFKVPREQVLEARKKNLPLSQIPHEVQVKTVLPNEFVYKEGLLTVKLTPIHDRTKYLAHQSLSQQIDENHLEKISNLLTETDLVVCLEEGTLPLLVMALGIPVILVDNYKYTTYGGVDYNSIERIRSSGVYVVPDEKYLIKQVQYCLKDHKNNVLKNQAIIRTVEDELGPQYGNATENILNEIELFMTQKKLVHA